MTALARQPALLLDRDGVVNLDHGYVARVDRFDFVDGIFALARGALDHGYRLVIVTNQSGIARGYYDEAEFRALSDWMSRRFQDEGAPLAGVFHCPFHPAGTRPGYARDSYWRKPNPGMILDAARLLGLDLPNSVMLGDQPSDMTAAAAAGVGMRVLIGGERLPPASTHAVIRTPPELLGLLPRAREARLERDRDGKEPRPIA